MPPRFCLGWKNILCNATTLNMKTSERTSTITGSTFRPGDSSVYSPVAQSKSLAYTSQYPIEPSLRRDPRPQPFQSSAMEMRRHRSSSRQQYRQKRYRDVRSMVLELPPAPAALVLVGLAFATLSALSAAAFLLIAVFGPPGGDRFRPLLTPAEAGGETGEEGLGEDYGIKVSCE